MLCAGDVVNLEKPAGQTYSLEELKSAVEEHKPALLFLVQVLMQQLLLLPSCSSALLQMLSLQCSLPSASEQLQHTASCMTTEHPHCKLQMHDACDRQQSTLTAISAWSKEAASPT